MHTTESELKTSVITTTNKQVWEVPYIKTTQEGGTLWINASSGEEASKLADLYLYPEEMPDGDLDSFYASIVDHTPADCDEDPMIDYEVEDVYPDERPDRMTNSLN